MNVEATDTLETTVHQDLVELGRFLHSIAESDISEIIDCYL
jgi:hypothetical protein